MKKKISHLCIFLIIFQIASALYANTMQEKFTDSKILYSAWVDFHNNRNVESCKNFISILENYLPENFNSYPDLKASAVNQQKEVLEASNEILKILEKSEAYEELSLQNQEQINSNIEKIDLCMLAYLRNQNYALEDTHQKFFNYFMWLLATILAGGIILIYLNVREIQKRDQIIYNSEQFLKHSIEVQEAERRRISRELHDTVAQSMRYVSLLAEGLSEKEQAEKIISTQNKNIQDIRKLCYNLTPPNFPEGELIDSLELLGSKIFETGESDSQKNDKVQLRFVLDDSVDFSIFKTEQLMNIYRILQEVFQNIKKHANANEVTVLFKSDFEKTEDKEFHLKIIITDDGCGMDEKLVNQINTGVIKNTEKLHFGLQNIFERVQLIGGTVIYRSEKDCGTQITVRV